MQVYIERYTCVLFLSYYLVVYQWFYTRGSCRVSAIHYFQCEICYHMTVSDCLFQVVTTIRSHSFIGYFKDALFRFLPQANTPTVTLTTSLSAGVSNLMHRHSELDIVVSQPATGREYKTHSFVLCRMFKSTRARKHPPMELEKQLKC